MLNMNNYVRARQLGDCESLQFPVEPTATTPNHDQTPVNDPAMFEEDAFDEHSVEATLAAVEDLSWKLEDLAREFKCCGYFDDDDDDDRPRAA